MFSFHVTEKYVAAAAFPLELLFVDHALVTLFLILYERLKEAPFSL